MTPPEIPERYILPAARSDWTGLLTDWQPLIPPQSSPWLLTKFGEVFFCQPDGKIGMLQVSGFQYQVVAKDKTDFQEWLVDPDKMSEWFLAPLVDRLESAGRTLGSDQCFSFITPLGLQGRLAADNVMIIPIPEHFGCWGDVFRQIKDMPEGSQVVLKPT
ncbi:MAG TPA: T6SS immunity protein Tdi1 domain-containing protein [Verrucomicrobiae bacterium]|jgi:hypothetical protein|nr:T6SS immunity protein Tdi1 domain-containing protein [Verrucomicrobiae bacterium]